MNLLSVVVWVCVILLACGVCYGAGVNRNQASAKAEIHELESKCRGWLARAVAWIKERV